MFGSTTLSKTEAENSKTEPASIQHARI